MCVNVCVFVCVCVCVCLCVCACACSMRNEMVGYIVADEKYDIVEGIKKMDF